MSSNIKTNLSNIDLLIKTRRMNTIPKEEGNGVLISFKATIGYTYYWSDNCFCLQKPMNLGNVIPIIPKKIS